MQGLLESLMKSEFDSNDINHEDNVPYTRKINGGSSEKDIDERLLISKMNGNNESKPSTNLETKMPLINSAAKSLIKNKDISADQTDGNVEDAKDV
ncbi:14857_t:CDS:2, partial [Racocetra fulgida]